MYRRYKRVAITYQTEPGKFQLIAVLRKLPDDAKLIKVRDELADGCSYLIFESQEWDLVGPGNKIPYFEPWITTAEEAAARITTDGDFPSSTYDPPVELETMEDYMQAFCICDMKYTGLKIHKPECPAR